MKFTLLVDLDPDDFAAVEAGDVDSITAPVMTIEVVQRDGLLTLERPVRLLDRLGFNVAKERETAFAGGVPIKVWFNPKESDAQA